MFIEVFANFLRKLTLQRHLIWNCVLRDLKNRYVGSFMGFFWAIVHPLVLLAAYTFVFSVVLRVQLRAGGTEPFSVFLFCGILPWIYFQDTVQRSCTSVVEQSSLIRKTLFPSEILPLVLVFSNLVTHLVGFLLLLAVLIYLNLLGGMVFLIIPYLFLLMLLALGLGWLVAALQVFLRDTAQVLSVIMVFWFWFTPVFYEVEMVPESFRFWIRLNPLAHVVEGYRALLLRNELPDALSLLMLVLSSLVLFVAGGYVFRTTKREFVDVL